MKIYTKTGDAGETGVFSGKRLSKSDIVVEALGCVDELNANLGAVITKIENPLQGKQKLTGRIASKSSKGLFKIISDLEKIQEELFAIGSFLAGFTYGDLEKILTEATERMEADIDQMTEKLPLLKNFILPGGTMTAAQIHVARAVCRRAERRIASVKTGKGHLARRSKLAISRYINRLSDYLFMLARLVNYLFSEKEKTWTWKY